MLLLILLQNLNPFFTKVCSILGGVHKMMRSAWPDISSLTEEKPESCPGERQATLPVHTCKNPVHSPIIHGSKTHTCGSITPSCGIFNARQCVLIWCWTKSNTCDCSMSGISLSYHDGQLPELSCCSLRFRTSPSGNGVANRNISTAPLSNTGFSGSVRLCMLLSPPEPVSFTVTYRTQTDCWCSRFYSFIINLSVWKR